MPQLLKFKHSADEFYKKEAEYFKENDVDFFSCYKNNIEDCIDCESTFRKTFLNAISRIDINPDWNFMDIGCGLGFPMYLSHKLFKNVYGVEVIPEIAQIAESNLTKMGVKNFQIINSHINLIDKNLLSKINVFYLFNPFINKTFSNFVENLVNSLGGGITKIQQKKFG